MIAPAPLALAPKYPLTAILCLAAATVSIGSMFGLSADPFLLDDRAFWGQPWRTLLTTLPHGSAMHLFFNLYWTWVLGVAVEHIFGPRIWTLMVIPGAVLASCAEFAFSQTPIGLSGVVFALFTFLWVVSRRIPRLRPIIDRRTALIFAAWFFVCIVLTAMNVLPIANVAHAGGAIYGALVGLALTSPPQRRRGLALATGVLLALSVFAAGTLREVINPAGMARAKAMRAYDLLEQGHTPEAMALLERARALQPRDAMIEMIYLDTAIRSGQMARALTVIDEMLGFMPPPLPKDDPLFFIALEAAERCLMQRDLDRAHEFTRRAAFINPDAPDPWAMLASVFDARSMPAAALLCLDRAISMAAEPAAFIQLRSALTRGQSQRP
jgi:membrane associated rhomboid family serine protease